MCKKAALDTLKELFNVCQKYYLLDQNIGTARVYGPCGTLLMENIKREWWQSFLMSSEVTVLPISSDISFPDEPMTLLTSEKLQESVLPQSTQSLLQSYLPTLPLVNRRLPFGVASCLTCSCNNSGGTDEMLLRYGYPSSWKSLQMAYFTSASKLFYWFNFWQRQRLIWWKKFSGKSSKFTLTNMTNSENEFQSVAIQYAFPWGSETVEVLRTYNTSSLRTAINANDEELLAKEGPKTISPQAVQCSTSLNLAAFVYLWNALTEKQQDGGLVLALHPRLTPFKVTVAITLPALRPLAELLSVQLKKVGVTVFPNPFLSTSSSLEMQCNRFDEMGIYYTIVLNENTQKTGVAYVRNRDTTVKEQIHVTEIKNKLPSYLQMATQNAT